MPKGWPLNRSELGTVPPSDKKRGAAFLKVALNLIKTYMPEQRNKDDVIEHIHRAIREYGE